MEEERDTRKITVELKNDLFKWISEQIKKDEFGNITHAINKCIRFAKENMKK